MTRAANIHLAGVAALALLTGAFSEQARRGLAEAVAAAMPAPGLRYLLPQYAAWVFIVVGFGYVTYLGARAVRTGPLAQQLIRFGNRRRLLVRLALAWLVRLGVLVATVLLAAAAVALIRGAAVDPRALLGAAPGFALWLLELIVVAAALASVGWRWPRGPVGMVAALLLVPLGAIEAEPLVHLAVLAALASGAISVLLFTVGKKDGITA